MPSRSSEHDNSVLKAVLSQLNIKSLDYDRLARDLGGCSKSAAKQRWYKCRDGIFGKVTKGKAKVKAGEGSSDDDVEFDGEKAAVTPANIATRTPATASKLPTAIKKENTGGNRIRNTPLRTVKIVSNPLVTTPKRSAKNMIGKRKGRSEDEDEDDWTDSDQEEDDEEVTNTTPSKTPVRVLPARETRALVQSATMVQADTDSEPEDWEMGGAEDGEEMKRKSKKIKTEVDEYDNGSDWGLDGLKMGT